MADVDTDPAALRHVRHSFALSNGEQHMIGWRLTLGGDSKEMSLPHWFAKVSVNKMYWLRDLD